MVEEAVGDRRHAEDLTGTAFVSAIEGLPRFRGPVDALGGWLFQVARHDVLDFRRRQARSRTGSPEEPKGPGTPERALAALFGGLTARSGLAGRSALNRLSPREREVLRLVAEGRTNRGIGGELLISVHTVACIWRTSSRSCRCTPSWRRSPSRSTTAGWTMVDDKVVRVGSVGTRCYVVLLLGCTGEGAAHYYVRQLWDMKGFIHLETMRPGDLVDYGRLCGWALARAHARSGDAAAVGGYLAPGTAATGRGRLRRGLRRPDRGRPRRLRPGRRGVDRPRSG